MTMSQQTQKRPSSPLSSQGAKKRILLHDGQNGKISEGSHENLRAILQEVLVKQVELVEQVVFKDRECQRLKRKFDEIDRNCRRWHEYAIGLQTRVKRLALILHRQKDSMKSLKDKGTSTAEVGVQAPSDLHESTPSVVRNPTETGGTVKEQHSNAAKPKKEFVVKKELKGSNPTVNSSPVVIDLTDEEKMKAPLEEPKQNRQPKHVVHHNPMAAVKPVVALTSHTARQENAPVSTSASKSVIQKVPHNGSVRDHVSPQNSGFKALSPSKAVANNSVPYPPLPPSPDIPSLPKNIPSPPPQPVLRIKKSDDGMELQWNHSTFTNQIKMQSYEIYVYQHNHNNHGSNRWKKIGNEPIRAMALPMACTLSQFSSSSKYYFAVRGKDVYGRYGAFSTPCCSSDVHK